MADTYESKMQRRVEQGTAIKIGNKYYSVEAPATKKQIGAASRLGMTSSNIDTVSPTSVANKAKTASESTINLALQWLSTIRSEARIAETAPLPESNEMLPFTKIMIWNPLGWVSVISQKQADKRDLQLAQTLKNRARTIVQNVSTITARLSPILRNMQITKANALKATYAQAKGFSSDDPYEEMVATNRSELEWYNKLYGTEDPIRIEALKTLERRDNQGKTSYELALEGKEMSAENVDALIAEIDETALADQVTLALQEEQKQAELAREAAQRRNKILLYSAGGLGIAFLLYRLTRR